MGQIILITGGVRSGKSSWALRMATESGRKPCIFVATAEAVDDEMRQRIRQHQQERGSSWVTRETPLDLPAALHALPPGSAAVIDCLTTWLGNVWHYRSSTDDILQATVEELTGALGTYHQGHDGLLVVVTNEVGWGIVPTDPAVRRYRDWAGTLNRKVAAVADYAYLCVMGLLVPLKGADGMALNLSYNTSASSSHQRKESSHEQCQ